MLVESALAAVEGRTVIRGGVSAERRMLAK
jgi:hypothetical protein